MIRAWHNQRGCMKKRYRMTSVLPESECLARFGRLLADEYVVCHREGLWLRSTDTPMVLLNFDRRYRSRNNWVGINPFVYVSGIEIELAGAGEQTRIEVVINQDRTLFFHVLLPVLCVPMLLAPSPHGVIAFVAVASVATLILRYLSGGLIRYSLQRCLRTG